MHAEMLQFSLDDDQWQQDWAVILSIASQPGQCRSCVKAALHKPTQRAVMLARLNGQSG